MSDPGTNFPANFATTATGWTQADDGTWSPPLDPGASGNLLVDGSQIVPHSIPSSALASTVQAALPGSGEVRMWAPTTAPNGWVLCDGSSYSTTNPLYTALFAAIGYTYGGAGANFNVPDLRGRSPIGAGTGTYAGATAHALASTGGEETHTLSTTEMPTHSHDIQHGNNGVLQSGSNVGVQQNSGSGFGGSPNLTQNSGGGAAHNTYHPFQAINFIIKL